jgi:hypothetical protein
VIKSAAYNLPCFVRVPAAQAGNDVSVFLQLALRIAATNLSDRGHERLKGKDRRLVITVEPLFSLRIL